MEMSATVDDHFSLESHTGSAQEATVERQGLGVAFQHVRERGFDVPDDGSCQAGPSGNSGLSAYGYLDVVFRYGTNLAVGLFT